MRPAHIEKPAVILFDWDNTLIDSWQVIHAALVETFIAMGKKPWDLEETKQRVQKSLRDSFPALFGEKWHDAADVFYESFEKLHIQNLKPMPFASEMLARASQLVDVLGVISNKTGKYLRKEVKHLDWDKYFFDVIGAGDADFDKPNAAPVNLFMQKNAIAFDAVIWYVGDSDIDIETAKNSGCIPVLINGQKEKLTKIEKNHNQISLASCKELATFLETI
ncbi:MAG: HAD family hydrolase [Pseudomonadota bacterium]|nr:HAD family hydrolase [Pseudomonadota bacterium]